jgi:hypothetical protein
VACLESFEWLRTELEDPPHSANQKESEDSLEVD